MLQTNAFRTHKTAIPGLLDIEVGWVEDERGYFQEKFQKEKLVANGLPADFNVVQQSVSYNKEAGVTRGFHAEPWEKYVSVINGRAFGVYVDLRPGETFGKKVEIELTPQRAVFLPRGVANSFQTLESETCYSYLVNAHWSPDAKYVSVNLADPEIAANWPISLDKAIISEKDRKHPMLAELR